MKLFVGLGNPGEKYAKNRHNIGFLALDRIAKRHQFSPWKKKFHSLTAEGEIGGERVLLLKPETFMNDSGRAVQDAARFLKIDLADIVVFHDELDLAPAKVKVKVGGGNAGHNGLRSITAHLQNDFKRVRLGIGHPGSKDAVVHYVLNDFAKSDYAWLDALLDAVAQAAARVAHGDDARFLTDVARFQSDLASLTQAPDEPAARRKSAPPSLVAKTPSRGAADNAQSSHPAGERAGKQKTALADNLKKWLAGRKSE